MYNWVVASSKAQKCKLREVRCSSLVGLNQRFLAKTVARVVEGGRLLLWNLSKILEQQLVSLD